jgi:hypothetical protein
MGKPVVKFIARQLFLARSVRQHPVDMHAPASIGIEINPFSIVAVFRTVVQSLRFCEPDFRATVNGNFIDIPCIIPIGTVYNMFSIRADAMPLAWFIGREQVRGAAISRQLVNS